MFHPRYSPTPRAPRKNTAASRFAATMVVPQLRWMASLFSPALRRRRASRAAPSTSSVERTPCTKKPSSVEKPLNLRPGSRSIITTMVACSRAWFRRRILFPNMFLSCRGYTNRLPTACNEYRIGSRNRNATKINATNRINKNATFSHLYTRIYVTPLYRRPPSGKPTFSPPPAKRQLDLAGLTKLVEQRQRGERDLPVPPPLVGLPHREVVRERHEGHPRRRHSPLHRERDRRYTLLLDGPADQPHGPVTQGSRGREQHGVHSVLDKLPHHLGSGPLDERSGLMDSRHKGEVPPVEFPHNPFDRELPQSPQRKDGVEVRAAAVGGVVRVGPGEGLDTHRDLTIRAIAGRVVYVEARPFR